MAVSAEDLAVFLEQDVNEQRAELLLSQARNLCLSVLSPLPDQADAVVLAVAARAYVNVSSARSVGLGSGQVSFGSTSGTQGVGGLYLSRSDRRNLRGMGTPAGSGAFSIDPTPMDAGTGLQLWNQNLPLPVPYAAVAPRAAVHVEAVSGVAP